MHKLILVSLVLALAPAAPTPAHAAAPARSRAAKGLKKRVNKRFTSTRGVHALWQMLRTKYSRIEGTITVNPEIIGALSGGKCQDIVVKGFTKGNLSDEVFSVTAFGTLSSGKCNYGMFVWPTKDLHVRAYYSGPSSSTPGDYIEITGGGGYFNAWAGSTHTKDLYLTYDFIK